MRIKSANELKHTAIVLLITLCSCRSYAIDIVKLQTHQMSENKAAHNAEVIKRALEITEPEYGAFKLEQINITMNSARLLQTLIAGELINVALGPERELWEQQVISVKVPVRLGLLSYRLLLTNKGALSNFEKVTTLQVLKAIPVGLHSGWMTTQVLKSNNFNVIEAGHFESLFLMLNKHRFDYIPRGIYEVYDELATHQPNLSNLVVEPTIALYMPTLSYVNISPSKPRLAKRLELGLLAMLETGELKTLLYKYYGEDIKRADLKNRKIFTIENPNFETQNSFKDKMLLTDLNS